MKEIPEIQSIMTATPVTVEFDQAAREARLIMTEYNIRHLPVVRGKQVVGVLSQRDLINAVEIEKELNETVYVSDICELDPYIAKPNAKLDSVLGEMANRAIGCTVVVDASKAVGIFTTVDACKGYADLLRSITLQ